MLFYNMHLLLNNASNLVHQQSHQVVGKNQGSDQFPSCKNDNAMHHTFLKNHILTDWPIIGIDIGLTFVLLVDNLHQ